MLQYTGEFVRLENNQVSSEKCEEEEKEEESEL